MALELNDLPDIDFVNTDVNKILNDMITGFEKAYYDSTGKQKKLYPGDPLRIWLYAQALREFQLRAIIDDAAKQNLLKYARKDNLQHLGAFSQTELLKEKHSQVRAKFILSQVQSTNVTIPANTRISPGSEIYFETTKDEVVLKGEKSIEFEAICTEAGEIGNGFTPGQINILVDPLPWIESVENIETSHGGADEEDAESYRERIYLAPEGYSVAGPEGAYKYYAKEYSTLIEDLKVISPAPSEIDLIVLLQDGEMPSEGFLEGLELHISDKTKRPLTDKVSVKKPEIEEYELLIKYFINAEDAGSESQITEQVEKAIEDYILWQKSKIGRDINPSYLVSNVIKAGAKRVEVTSPVFTKVGEVKLAQISDKNIEYGGLEDE